LKGGNPLYGVEDGLALRPTAAKKRRPHENEKEAVNKEQNAKKEEITINRTLGKNSIYPETSSVEGMRRSEEREV